jgi:sRNA-binding regulator protein Hfq
MGPENNDTQAGEWSEVDAIKQMAHGPVAIFTHSGLKLVGHIRQFNERAILFTRMDKGTLQLVFLAGVTTIQPATKEECHQVGQGGPFSKSARPRT